ncbi:UDP-glycosyltransferase 91c1 [Phtheirospermum japonicum]|uniref:UDP-glycosyltransferase 91c1 n=1 Tax=Phtheirospermum japonicum TaxID=374723 RepID=A0A830C055_9LAMI|nr:UDP-glycosyltransferase 91c1 [Phtheirospermum japonicum]
MKEEQSIKVLHIVMLPWLAIGHLRPFFRLSECLAQKGHRISFISTPRNLQRSIKVPQHLSHLINLVAFPLPEVENLPPHAESSMDVSFAKQQLLKVALDSLEPSIRDFLENAEPKPDWIVYDYASHWLPKLAEETGISRAFFSLFTAAFMAFLGPPDVLTSQGYSRSTAEDYTVVPEWVPFPTDVVFRRHELEKNMEKGNVYDSGTSDPIRFGLSIAGSEIVIFRSYVEFEPEWFDLIRQLYKKPVIPVGALPIGDINSNQSEDNNTTEWLRIKQWLDSQKQNSVVYVALGTEATLSPKETHELALGLEQSGSPFFWVLNRGHLLETLPCGFRDRIRDRGMVYTEWAPQVRILSHPAVGGFLTHCGWNSVTEALGFGRVLILLPVMNDQGLNARLLKKKGVGVEITRDEDGSFTCDSVAGSVRLAMVGDEGRGVRDNARRMEELFGDKNRSDCCIDSLVQLMVETKKKTSSQ